MKNTFGMYVSRFVFVWGLVWERKQFQYAQHHSSSYSYIFRNAFEIILMKWIPFVENEAGYQPFYPFYPSSVLCSIYINMDELLLNRRYVTCEKLQYSNINKVENICWIMHFNGNFIFPMREMCDIQSYIELIFVTKCMWKKKNASQCL